MINGLDELIHRKKNRGDPDLGPCAVMVAMKRDLDGLRAEVGLRGKPTGRFLGSNIYRTAGDGANICLVGPVLGAPYAVMVLEKLGILGVKRVVFLGWCGAISSSVQIGDLVVPNQGVIGEGTSGYYQQKAFSAPSLEMTALIERFTGCASVDVHQGPVWSTDAPYRETRSKVVALQGEGVLGVDMEVSALFSAGRFRDISVGALLVVSDELSSLTWIPGFSTDRFKKTRKIALKIIGRICRQMS